MNPATNNSKITWRNFQAAQTDSGKQPGLPLSIGLFGSFTVEPLVPWLGGQLLEANLDVLPQLAVGPFNQVFQTCMGDPAVAFGRDVDAIIMLWRLEDLFGDLLGAAVGGDAAAITELNDELHKLVSAVATLRQKHAGTLIVAVPPYPLTPAFDPQNSIQPSAAMGLYNALVQSWETGIDAIGNVIPVNLHSLLMADGYKASHDNRKWYLYRQPYKELFWSSLGANLTRLLAAQRRSSKKCVVLDCDNTLWGGIVGEDGLAGIAIGEDFPGLAFRDFQKYLLHLQQRGILLAIASKNNPEDVFEVFDNHDAMVLRREHISVFEVHWRSKVESLENIAKTLNIGVDALVFIDDNAKEIAEVSERMPEVHCCIVPEDLAALPQLLAGSALFDSTDITEEDKRRTEMIRLDQKRQESQGTLSEEDFLKSLQLSINVFSAEPKHLARITQLINKTNQFNLTTLRRTREEVEALMGKPDSLLLAMTIADRYGDYGLVGVAVLRQESGPLWHIDTLLMSCRVLGRGAETAFLAKIGEAVRARNGAQLKGRYLETKKNALVRDFYKDHGFGQSPDTATDWIADIAALRQPGEHVAVTLSVFNP